MSYTEYPKVMRHPQSRPAVPYKQPRYRPGEEGWGKPVVAGETGKPAMFPDVHVHNVDQEQQYAAKGYVPAGRADPDAYRKSMTGNEAIPESSFVEFPKMMYKRNPKAESEETMLESTTVATPDAERALLAEGWKKTPAEAKPAEAPAATRSGATGKGQAKSAAAEEARREKIRASMKRRAAEKKAAADHPAA